MKNSKLVGDGPYKLSHKDGPQQFMSQRSLLMSFLLCINTYLNSEYKQSPKTLTFKEVLTITDDHLASLHYCKMNNDRGSHLVH